MSTVLQDRLGYTFKDKKLLKVALTHPSLDGQESYQRLEFLGDRVLGLVISTWLFDLYPKEKEGTLNAKFSFLVRGSTLADLARSLDISPHIRVATSAEKDGSAANDSVLADVMEAIIGALYQDSGFREAERFIKHHWAGLLKTVDSAEQDPKTALQEWAQGRGLPLPEYKMIDRSGPDHDPKFTIEVLVGATLKASADGKSKREAEKKAASALMSEVDNGE